MAATSPSYAFNASAVALGGVIHKDSRSIVIPTVGSVSLASAGGEAENRVDNYFREDISFSRAETRVSGYSAPLAAGSSSRRYTTYSEVMLKNLKIFDRLEIGFMKAIVTSSRVLDTAAPDPIMQLQPDRSEFSIRLFYENIVVDGEDVTPTADFELCHAGTYDQFLERACTIAEALPAHTDESFEVAKTVKGFLDGKPATTIATNSTADAVVPWHRPPVNVPLVTLQGPPGLVSNAAKLPSFGRARFGDALIKPDRQRVALLRLRLDSDWSKTKPLATDGGSVILSDAQFFSTDDGDGGSVSSDGGSNGVPIWP